MDRRFNFPEGGVALDSLPSQRGSTSCTAGLRHDLLRFHQRQRYKFQGDFVTLANDPACRDAESRATPEGGKKLGATRAQTGVKYSKIDLS
jgi:hypothetical protein